LSERSPSPLPNNPVLCRDESVERTASWVIVALFVLTTSLVGAALVGPQLHSMLSVASMVPAGWSGLVMELKRWQEQRRSVWTHLARALPLGVLLQVVMLGISAMD